MRAAAGLIHVCCSYSPGKHGNKQNKFMSSFINPSDTFFMYIYILLPGLVSRVHQVLNVIIGGDGQLGQIFNIGSQQGVLSDSQVAFVFGVEKVTHTLTVDLHVAHLQTKQKKSSREGVLISNQASKENLKVSIYFCQHNKRTQLFNFYNI